eukprot:m51a1_g12340 hypothetical protein (574) ;mRNA; f:508131-510377
MPHDSLQQPSINDPMSPYEAAAAAARAQQQQQQQQQQQREAASSERARLLSASQGPRGGDDLKRSSHRGDPKNTNAATLQLRHVALLVEMLFLSYVEMCLVPALPKISEKWKDNAHWVPWVLSAYNIAGAVWTPIAGSLADIYGPKWVAIGSLTMYAAGQIGCALAPNLWTLIAFRALQGFGMAIFVLCFAIIRVTFPTRIVPVAIGSISAMFSVGMCIGLVGGALAMDRMEHWQNVFWTSFPVITSVALAFTFTMPNFHGVNSKRRPDFAGALLIACGITCFLIGVTLSSEWTWVDWKTLLLVGGGLGILVVFVAVELVVRDPLVSIRLLLRRNLALSAIVAFTVGLALFSLFQVVPYLLGDPETDILPTGKKSMVYMGLVMLPFGLSQFVTAPLSGVLGKYVGFPILSSAAMLGITATYCLLIRWHYTLAAAIGLTILMGGSFGVIMVSIMNTVSESCTKEQFGSASGTNTLFRIFGGAVGPVVVNTVLNRHPKLWPPALPGSESSHEAHQVALPSDQGYVDAFVLMAGFAGFGLLVTLFLSGLCKACARPSPEEQRRALIRSKTGSSRRR